MSFQDLGVSRAVTTALSQRGINEPFAIQKLVIADVLAGRDVLAQSPTGSGKTLAFGIPMVDRIDPNNAPRPAALVLAPTRELVSQIVEELRPLAHARALKIASVYGGVGIQKQAREATKAQIVVATPGRLEDLLDRRAFRLDRVQLLVLDEADRMLDMGFRPAVDRIVGQCPAKRQTLFFSATLEGEAGKAAREYTADPVKHSHAPSQRKIEAIEHRFVKVEREERMDELVRQLRDDRELTLVFVRTKRGADRLVKKLGNSGVEAVAMHGDKSQAQREKALARFGSGRVDTLIATDVAARGIDVAGISHVINFDPPEDSDTYVHRTGRTGRAGRTGVGITFFGHEQARDVEKIARGLKLAAEFARSGHVSGGGAEAGDRRRGGHARSNGSGPSSGRPRKPMAGSVRGSGPRSGDGRDSRGPGSKAKKNPGSRRAKAAARDGGGEGGGGSVSWSSDGRKSGRSSGPRRGR
jgi:superfamily II DNA/RNA helicase